ncbi:MAG: SusC/RagA family TonB-linked outer membrane protein [Chitinophagaceae bacterium]|nr:SusC/RagA family TonB-linked outer membrane protein [Chitinophagaceae bacterium]
MTLKKIRGLLVLPVVLLISQLAFSQNKTVTGKVTDSKDGSPIAGASVLIKGSTGGTNTNAEGSFSMNVPASATALIISAVGYSDQEVAITSDGAVSVALAATGGNLNEVVVVGYGTVRRKDLTGAVTSVQAKNFNQGVVTSPDQLLQNKVPGLEITNNSGQPGAVTTVKIRGNNSIRAANNPLYVIDGVPLDGRSARPSSATTFGTTPDLNPLLYINPNDIASIDILKDASSSAIYGSRGANGVIVITTKKGGTGASKIEMGANWGVFAGYLKKFEILDADEFRSAIKKYNLNANLDGGKSVDALDEITSNELTQNYNLAFSGGNENGRFRASFLASKTPGFLKNSAINKYIGSFNGGYKFLDKKLSLDFGLIAGHVGEDIPNVSNTAGSQGNLISAALSWNPTMSFTDPTTGFYVFPTNGSGNPLALFTGVADRADVNTFLGNISAGYEIIKNLQYKFLYAINHSTGQRNINLYGWLQGYTGLSGSGFGAKAYSNLTSQTFTHTLNYRADLTQGLSLESVVGYEYWKSDYGTSAYSAQGFNTNLTQQNILDIPYTNILRNGNTQNLPITAVNPRTELQSLFGRVIFNLRDKYYITATIRRDGSSKFGENKKYGNFPSVAAKWAISNEQFMKDGELFSNLALRASWGITGNQEFPEGASQEQFSFSSYNNAGQINVANPDLKWEETTSYNLGLDFGLFQGRIYGSIDYYKKTTTDILFQSTAIQPAPASIYFINIPGNLVNKGIELGIGASIIEKRDFGWDLNFNISNNKNTLEDFFAPGSKTPLSILTGQINGQGVSGTLAQIITNDQPVNEFYLKPFKGFDANGNQMVDPDPVFSGDPNPQTLYGISTTLRYKKLGLVINSGGAGGYMIYNNTATNITNISGIVSGRNIDKAAFNSAEKTTSGAVVSSRYLEKGNYFKLRNVSLSYNFGNIGEYIKGLNAFVNATNLFVITKFTGFDPEVNIDKSAGGYPSRSIEYIPYPTPRTISFGFNLSL